MVPADRSSRSGCRSAACAAALRGVGAGFLVAMGLLPAGCGGDGGGSLERAAPAPPAAAAVSSGETSAVLPVPRPEPALIGLRELEAWTETAVHWLDDLAVRLRLRDFGGVASALAENFAGHHPLGGEPIEEGGLPLGAERALRGAAGAEVLDREAFLAALEDLIGPWRRVEHVRLHVRGAEFARGRPVGRGRLDLVIEVHGTRPEGGRHALDGEARLGIVREGQTWFIEAFELVRMEERRRARAIFSDVTTAAGVAHEGIRFGRPGNDSDAWQGAAVADVDGDGRWDLFVPSSERNFLYLGRASGGFSEEAEARGLLLPGGGTGAVFFDQNGDGHVDLAVAHFGMRRPNRSVEGQPLRFYRNDGRGRFREVADELGLDVVTAATSLVAFDVHGNGHVDLFVCGYGRMDRARNDSWLEATNGAPNTLLANREGLAFEDVTRAAGLMDQRWSYAAAAADFDRDGFLDLYVGNNFGTNRLYRNRGDGTFEDVAPGLGVAERGNTMGVAWGDMDGDGRLDLYVVGPESSAGKRVLGRVGELASTVQVDELRRLASGNALFLGREDGFERGPREGGATDAGWAWGVALADFDLDGRLDVYCANGFVTGDLPEDT